jgi:sulfite reductase (ferredoxin)
MPGFYALFVGGDFAGTRLNAQLADKVPLNAIADVLDPLLALYASTRADGEGFGDFCHRIGMRALQQALAERQKGAA